MEERTLELVETDSNFVVHIYQNDEAVQCEFGASGSEITENECELWGVTGTENRCSWR